MKINTTQKKSVSVKTLQFFGMRGVYKQHSAKTIKKALR